MFLVSELINNAEIFRLAAVADPESVNAGSHQRLDLVLFKTVEVLVVFYFFDEVPAAVSNFDIVLVEGKRCKAEGAVSPRSGKGA